MPELRYNYIRFKLSIRVMFKNFLLIYSTGESKVILPVKWCSNLFIIFYSKKEKKKDLKESVENNAEIIVTFIVENRHKISVVITTRPRALMPVGNSIIVFVIY